MVIILYLWYIQNGAPKLLLMAQPLKYPQSESAYDEQYASKQQPSACLLPIFFNATGSHFTAQECRILH